VNTIVLAVPGTRQIRKLPANSVTILHRQGQREAGLITIVVEDGLFRHHVSLKRGSDDRFEGTCRTLDVEERVVRSFALRGVLCDSGGTSAVILGLSRWADEVEGEMEWMGDFKCVQRVRSGLTGDADSSRQS
jgi:hypothetical protein